MARVFIAQISLTVIHVFGMNNVNRVLAYEWSRSGIVNYIVMFRGAGEAANKIANIRAGKNFPGGPGKTRHRAKNVKNNNIKDSQRILLNHIAREIGLKRFLREPLENDEGPGVRICIALWGAVPPRCALLAKTKEDPTIWNWDSVLADADSLDGLGFRQCSFPTRNIAQMMYRSC